MHEKVDIPLHSPGTCGAPDAIQEQYSHENDRNVSSAFDKMQHDDVHDPMYENVLVKGNLVNIESNTMKDNTSCNTQPKPSNFNIREVSMKEEIFSPTENLIIE